MKGRLTLDQLPPALQEQAMAQRVPVCARRWGTVKTGWTFCTLVRGHPGECFNSVKGPKPADALFWEQQPDAIKQYADQVEGEKRRIAKGAAGE